MMLDSLQALQSRAAARAPLCTQVSDVLTSLGVLHLCQASTPDDCLLVDLLIGQPQQQFALSIETFVRNTGKRRGEPCAELSTACIRSCTLPSQSCDAGDCVAMDRLVRAQGWEPVAVSEQEWQGLGSLAERQAYLRSVLPAGVLPAAA